MPLAKDSRIKLSLTPAAEQFARRRARPVPGGPALSESVSTALERYQELIDGAARSLPLTQAERDYLCDVLNGTVLDSAAISGLALEVLDAKPEFGEKWGIDPAALAEKLRAMPLLGRTAVVEMVEAFWQSEREAQRLREAARQERIRCGAEPANG